MSNKQLELIPLNGVGKSSTKPVKPRKQRQPNPDSISKQKLWYPKANGTLRKVTYPYACTLRRHQGIDLFSLRINGGTANKLHTPDGEIDASAALVAHLDKPVVQEEITQLTQEELSKVLQGCVKNNSLQGPEYFISKSEYDAFARKLGFKDHVALEAYDDWHEGMTHRDEGREYFDGYKEGINPEDMPQIKTLEQELTELTVHQAKQLKEADRQLKFVENEANTNQAEIQAAYDRLLRSSQAMSGAADSIMVLVDKLKPLSHPITVKELEELDYEDPLPYIDDDSDDLPF